MAIGNLEKRFIRMQFGDKLRSRIYRKLNRFLDNGVSLARTLDIMWMHASNDGKKPKAVAAVVLDEWRRQVSNGKNFGEAIKGWVPDSDRLVIEGGERAGNLSVAIEKAMAVSASSKKIKSTLVKGLAYPVVLIMIAIGFMIMFGTQVIPAFEEILPREQWTGAGAQMGIVSDIVEFYLIPALVLFAALGVLITVSMPRWKAGMRVKFDKYPPWSIYRLVIGSGFMLTIAGMVKAGITVPNALSMLAKSAQPWYRHRLERTLRFVSVGHNLGEALHRTQFEFPDKDSVQDLRAYANLKGFDESLEAMGNEWLTESVEKIEAQTAILKNVGFIVLGGVFMWIAIGIGSLQQQITSAL